MVETNKQLRDLYQDMVDNKSAAFADLSNKIKQIWTDIDERKLILFKNEPCPRKKRLPVDEFERFQGALKDAKKDRDASYRMLHIVKHLLKVTKRILYQAGLAKRWRETHTSDPEKVGQPIRKPVPLVSTGSLESKNLELTPAVMAEFRQHAAILGMDKGMVYLTSSVVMSFEEALQHTFAFGRSLALLEKRVEKFKTRIQTATNGFETKNAFEILANLLEEEVRAWILGIGIPLLHPSYYNRIHHRRRLRTGKEKEKRRTLFQIHQNSKRWNWMDLVLGATIFNTCR